MKKSIMLGLGACALALGGVAALMGQKPFIETKATGVTGTVTLDVTNKWSSGESGQHYAVYFYEGTPGGTPTNSGWSSYVFGAKDCGYITLSYTLDFTPNHMIAVRYANWYEENKADHWKDNKWGHDGWNDTGKWNQTQDLDYYDNAHINVTDWGWGKVNDKAYVVPGDEDWSSKTDLWNIKLNGSNHCEYYSDTVSLAKDVEFKVYYRETGYGDEKCTLSGFVTDKFEINKGNENDEKIVCRVAGTYAIYFDATGSIYITDPVAAAADEWAQSFLAGVTCDGNGSITKDEWTTLSGTYAALDDDVKAIFTGIAEDGNDSGTYAEKAVCRYDYIVKKYGTTAKPDFMGRKAAGKIDPKASYSFTALNDGGDNTIAITIGISGIATLALCGAFLLRKRKAE